MIETLALCTALTVLAIGFLVPVGWALLGITIQVRIGAIPPPEIRQKGDGWKILLEVKIRLRDRAS